MGPFTAVLATLILTGLAVLQLLLAAGKPLGHYAWGGVHRVLPPRLRVASALSVVLYALFGWVLLEASLLIDTPLSNSLSHTGAWVLFGYFALGIVMNGISRSKPERAVMTPLVAILALCALAVAVS